MWEGNEGVIWEEVKRMDMIKTHCTKCEAIKGKKDSAEAILRGRAFTEHESPPLTTTTNKPWSWDTVIHTCKPSTLRCAETETEGSRV